MKSATVTWITYNNYGTELQAFALQQFILSLGIENVIISDELMLEKAKPQESNSAVQQHVDNSALQERNFLSTIKRILKKYLFNLKACVTLVKDLIVAYKLQFEQNKREKARRAYFDSQEKFNAFKKDKLNILYNVSGENVSSLNDEIDVFICGSDQIWSPLDCNFNGYYYLDFVKKKKISYASSLGTTDISDEKKEIIKNWTKDYFKVSVRESQSANQLSELLNRNVDWVLDPTLLFDKSFWDKQRNNYRTKKKYIVCYFLENKEWYLSYAKSLSRHLNMDFYIIPSSKVYSENNHSFKRGIGPQEFVDVIAKSSFVLTDSYHASIFSLIFEKNFLYLKRFKDDAPNCQNIRIDSLFGLLNITDLIVEEKQFSEQDIQKLDYSIINQILDKERTCSQNYLKGCLL